MILWPFQSQRFKASLYLFSQQILKEKAFFQLNYVLLFPGHCLQRIPAKAKTKLSCLSIILTFTCFQCFQCFHLPLGKYKVQVGVVHKIQELASKIRIALKDTYVWPKST